MGVNVAKVVKAVRILSGTEKTKQVTNAALGEWINDGVADLYDRIIQADESYYSSSAALTFGTGSPESASTAALPADFYHMRGVKRAPGTPRETPVFPVTETDSNRKLGYILRGMNIQITPYAAVSLGPFEVRYAPNPPQFGRLLDISVAADDGVISGPSSEKALRVRNGEFTNADLGRKLFLYNCENSADNLGPTYTTNGSVTLLTRPEGGSSVIDLNDSVITLAIESFTESTIAMVNDSTNVFELDEFLSNFVHYVECYAAAKVLEKKKQPTDDMVRQMNAEIARITAAAPDRESEPEAAPVLWQPRGQFRGHGWGGGY